MRKSFLRTGFGLALAIGLLSGCGVKAPDDVDDAEKNINWDVDLSNPITLKGVFPYSGSQSFGNDDTSKIIEDETGYRCEYTSLSASSADNDVANIFLNQTKYNFIKMTEAQFHPNAKDGTLLRLDSLLEKTESGRILKEIISLMDYGWDPVTYTDANGKKSIYGVPDFGYCVMIDSAMVWNSQDLIDIGYKDENNEPKVPETLGEFTDALEKLQAKNGANNSNYHAFSIAGSNNVDVGAIESCFDCPLNFYVDEDGNIQKDVFSDSYSNYVEYMHTLRENGCLSKNWQNLDQARCLADFENGNTSMTILPYWWVQSLVDGIVNVNKLATKRGVENNYQTVHDKVICWNTRLRGDGTSGSVVQEKARIQGSAAGAGYFTVIPYYMASTAVYTIDYLAKKALHYANFYGGTSLSLKEIEAMKRSDGTPISEDWIKNNVHWEQTATPEGAKDYYEANDRSYEQYESFADKVVYLEPYSYSISYEIDPALKHDVKDGETKTTQKNNETITESLSGNTMTYSVQGGGIWVKILDRYQQEIVDNSGYATGTNSIAARTLFHLREVAFDGWRVSTPNDDTIIDNPMSMAPIMPHWAPISILSRTVAKRGLATAIDCPSSTTPTKALNVTRQSLRETYKRSSDGNRYYYWSDDIVKEMTAWYKTKIARAS